jgi:hypothetical protein
VSSAAAQSGFGKAARRAEDWFLDPVPVHVMVLNRLILGGVLFLHAVSRLPEFELLYGSSAGAWSPAYREFVSTFLAQDLSRLLLWVVAGLEQLGPEPRQLVLVTLYGALLASSIGFASGLFTRATGCVAAVLQLLFVAIHPLAHYGWAGMVAPFTLYVALSRAGDYASIDAWRRRRRTRGPAASGMAPAWPMRLLQIHVAMMYFHTGFARIDDPAWLQGQALFEALARTIFTRFTFDLHAWSSELSLLCYAVFVLEPAAVVLLWIPRIRTLCALALIAMHLTLEILTNVGWWNYIMIGGLLTFLPPQWMARLLRRIPP